MKNLTLFKIITNYQLFEIFVLGIISGIPLAIIVTTIVAWLKESGITIEVITTFAVARLAYSLKPLWSPIVDYCSIPGLNRFGRRKSWMIFCSLLISFVLYALSNTSPNSTLSTLYVLTICLGIFSATFDISFDAFRIERLEQNTQGLGAACAVFGYRIGLLLAGGGALYLAHIIDSWAQTFLYMSGIFIISVVFIFFINEQQYDTKSSIDISLRNLRILVIKPFIDFLNREGSVPVLLAVIFFKLGDAMLGVVSIPFYLELGYSKEQIAIAVKIYGFAATILGTYAGGFIIYKIGYFRGLIVSGIVQSITHLTFVWLNHQNADFQALFTAISIENFAAGMGAAALVAYVSILCNKKYAATQYAMLSSAASLFNNTVTIYGGTLVHQIGWDYFFILTIILAIPGILLLVYLQKRYKHIIID